MTKDNGAGRDIVICMNKDDFLHKTGGFSPIDGEMGRIEAFWSMGRIPRYFTEDNKIFIVSSTNKHVMGFVECLEFNFLDVNGETLVWDSDTFEYIVSIPCKPFRGFRYRWFEYELEKGHRERINS